MQAPSCSNAPDSIQKPDRRSLLTYLAAPEVKKAYRISSDVEEFLAPEMKCQPPQDGDDFLMIEHDK